MFAHDSIIQLVQTFGYPGIFAAVLIESGLFFGFFLPGSSMLFTAGLLASKGLFSPWILIPLVTVAAVLGDSIGYWFGAKIGEPFIRRSRWVKQAHLDSAQAFYERHGVQAVLLARFIPAIRTFAPIVAGIVKMNYRVFLIYNIAGAILWAAGVTFAGYFLGARVPFVSEYITQIVLAIIVISLIPVAHEAYKAHRKRK